MLEMQDIRKEFGAVIALDSVNFSVKKGEIHGLLGGNGAGKTTLMNILYGLYKSNAGKISIDGAPLTINSPKDAIAGGIGMVHQQFLQIDRFTVTENIVLGTKLKNWPSLDLEVEKQKILELSKHFGLPVNPDAYINELPMGIRQRVEILKALYRGVKVLVLDEPTTNLTPQEVDGLFVSLRLMVNDGLSVVFITHKLPEVLAVCDRISVLRHGKNVLTLDRTEASEEAFVKAMVGDDLNIEQSIIFSAENLHKRLGQVGGEDALSVKAMTISTGEIKSVSACSFEIKTGEILGVAGVSGNGQLEMLEGILGLRQIAAGEVWIRDVEVTELAPQETLNQGVAYIPEDRWQDGYLPKATVAQNLILGLHRREPYSDGHFLRGKQIFEQSEALIKDFNIKTNGPDDTAGNLSGGNIQRVMLARAFSHPVDLLLAHNPTRGLDIPSMESIYEKVLERKEKGMATLLVSENLDELFLLSNRIIVICGGEIMGELPRDKFDKYAIGLMMSGVRQDE